jgi:hypothetical protein
MGLDFHEGRYLHFEICTCILFIFILKGINYGYSKSKLKVSSIYISHKNHS